MKYLTKKRIIWSAAALGLLWLGKIVIYDDIIRCNLSHSSLETSDSPQAAFQGFGVTPAPSAIVAVITAEESHAVSSLIEGIEAQIASTSLLFEPTIRSCLGAKCFDMPANGLERIGLLAPPSSGAEALLRTINRITPNLDSSKAKILVESAVPAYGYGKNHGWSRIIRLVRSPIPQAFQLLHEGKIFEPSVLESQVRQLVRWHCRLSHVAAHTRMLTVFLDDFMVRPLFHLEQILSFAGVPLPDRLVLRSLAEELQRELRSELTFENATHLISSFSTNGNKDIEALVKQAGDSLRDEIVETKGLSMWPCRSFRSISPAPVVPARLLVPNCSSPWVTCSVDYDRQEAAEARVGRGI